MKLKKIKYYDFAYETTYIVEEKKRQEKIRTQIWMKEDMKEMKSSAEEVKQEIGISSKYETKVTKYQERELMKKIMEESFKKKIIKYYEEERK
jgi:hypothetical protein